MERRADLRRSWAESEIRPADLVGAIVNEAGIDPRAIGAIQIADRFSLVEVPEEVADEIIGTLRAATIKGRRVPVHSRSRAKKPGERDDPKAYID